MSRYQVGEYAGVALIAVAIGAFSVAAAVGAVGVYLLVASVLAQMGGNSNE